MTFSEAIFNPLYKPPYIMAMNLYFISSSAYGVESYSTHFVYVFVLQANLCEYLILLLLQHRFKTLTSDNLQV